MALRVSLGVFRAHDSVFNEASHVGMIASQAGCAVAADQVETAISDMREGKLTADDGQSGTCRTHAAEVRVFDCIALDRLVRGLQPRTQNQLWITGEIVIINVAYGLDRKAAGFLASLVTAHAVGDNSQPAFTSELVFSLRLPI